MSDAAISTAHLPAVLNAVPDINFTENKGGGGCFSFLYILLYLCSVIRTQFVFSSD